MSVITKLKSEVLKAKIRYIKKTRYKSVLNNLGDEIVRSNHFKNNDLELGFKQRITHTVDEEIIERIIKAYNKSKAVQKTLSQAFQVGNEWLPIYNGYMNDIMVALSTSNKTDTNRIYANFLREKCSIGLHGLPCDMLTDFFSGRISKLDRNIYLHDAIYRYNHWKQLTDNKYPINDLQMSEYGNSYGFYVGDQYLRPGSEYLHYYATRISQLIENGQEKKVVVELGGGFGGLGYFLNKVIPDITYIDFDLPENMALTAYYLMNSYPEKKFLLYGEDDFSKKSFEAYDIIILPNFEIVNLPSDSVNLAFNSYSLAEMSTETINTYIPELKRASKEYIYHINHTKVSNSLKADEFGIEDDNYKLLYKKPALWNLGRNTNMDEAEYLYSKRLQANSSLNK